MSCGAKVGFSLETISFKVDKEIGSNSDSIAGASRTVKGTYVHCCVLFRVSDMRPTKTCKKLSHNSTDVSSYQLLKKELSDFGNFSQ